MYQKIQDRIVKLIPQDKALHFIAGFILTILSSYFLAPIYSTLFVFVVAVIKEIRDEIVYGGFDLKDILFTIAPAIILNFK